MEQITNSVFVEGNIFACNLGLVTTREGNVLIDTPHLITDALRWRDEVMKKGEVKYLINTEEHPDHTETSQLFPGILISHVNTRQHLSTIETETVIRRQLHLDPEGKEFHQGFRLRLADITFSKSLDFYLGDLSFRLIHLPGHSPGGIAVYIPEERLVFATDIIFNKKKSWLHEADPDVWLESLNRIKGLDVDTIIPGHGAPCTKDYLFEQMKIIQGWIDVVKSAINKGLELEEAFNDIVVPDPYPKQAGTPFTEEELNQMIISRLYSIYKN